MALTPYQRHRKEWVSCTRCPLHETRLRVCLARGSIPCDVALVGEAPGKNENPLGQPFIGPAGQELDRQIDEAGGNSSFCSECGGFQFRDRDEALTCGKGHRNATGFKLRFLFSNLLGCIPYDPDSDDGSKVTRPELEQVEACMPRLQELLKIADPDLVVCVGEEAFSWLDPKFKSGITLHRPITVKQIVHPAYILRQNIAQQSLLSKRSEVQLRHYFEELSAWKVVNGKI